MASGLRSFYILFITYHEFWVGELLGTRILWVFSEVNMSFIVVWRGEAFVYKHKQDEACGRWTLEWLLDKVRVGGFPKAKAKKIFGQAWDKFCWMRRGHGLPKEEDVDHCHCHIPTMFHLSHLSCFHIGSSFHVEVYTLPLMKKLHIRVVC